MTADKSKKKAHIFIRMGLTDGLSAENFWVNELEEVETS